MRVIITTNAVGGVWQYATTLAQVLCERHAAQVLLVVCGPEPGQERLGSLPLGIRANGGSIELESLQIPLEWDEAAIDADLLAGRQALLRLALAWRAHVLHVNEHHLGALGSEGLPVLLVSHSDLCSWQTAMGGSPAAVRPEYLVRVRAGLAGAAMVVAPSGSVASALCAQYGYLDVVRVIPNGVLEVPVLDTGGARIDALMAGRLWDPAKNLATYSEAVAGLTEGRFLAIGPRSADEPPRPADYDGNLEYTGPLSNSEVWATLRRTQLLVAPARYEPFGLVAVEAAMSGCCLLLSDIPSYRAIWEDTAAYFPATDALALRRTITSLLADEPRRIHLAAAAQARARHSYTAERMARAYMRCYQRLALRYGLAI